MITYVNSKDAQLFDLAREALLENYGIDVGDNWNLDSYLNRLIQLQEISPKYVRLPLYEDGHRDEEIFEINANERTIKVPPTFSKNGVGVVSDELAETIWFRINRYFDIKDFGQAAGKVGNVLDDGDLHILIQWEAPDKAKGASWAYAIDIDTDPEYVYFGWALTAQHLTKQAGNIKFGIRILQYDSDGIAYSFSTQAAQIAVKPGLSFDLTDADVKFEDVADKISNRLMGGQIAHCPVFETDLPTYILNLSVPENAGDDALPEARLEVVAAAPSDEEYDAIAYKWYAQGPRDTEFVQVPGEFTPALTVRSSGSYYVVVFGMKEIIDSYENIYDEENEEVIEHQKFKFHASVASSKSAICRIPAPTKLEITEPLVKFLVLQNDPVLVMQVKRQDIEGTVVGDVSLRIEKTASAEKDLDLETAEFTLVEEATAGTDSIPEAWIFDGEAYPTEEEAIEAKGENEGEIIHREAVPGSAGTPGISYEVDGDMITIDMQAAEEGYYRVTVINTLNGSEELTPNPEVDQDEFDICRVVKPAEIRDAHAQLLTRSDEVSSADEGSVSRGNKIRAEVDIAGLSDELEIRWYKVVDEQDPDPDASEDDVLLDVQGDIFIPDDDGFYYFTAKNIVEDSEVLVRSNVIRFAA